MSWVTGEVAKRSYGLVRRAPDEEREGVATSAENKVRAGCKYMVQREVSIGACDLRIHVLFLWFLCGSRQEERNVVFFLDLRSEIRVHS